MTLVAAFKSVGGVPILLGDILLSTEDGPCGVEKKVHRINDHFVVGWAGDRDAASHLMHDLYGTFHPGPCIGDDVLKFLAQYPVDQLNSDPDSVALVGWVMDVPNRKGLCFRWDSLQPQRFDFRSPLFIGSGDATFNDIYTTERSGDPTSIVPGFEAAKEALHLVTHLQMDEFVGERNQKERWFGRAYEILVQAGNRFEYVDDVLYLALDLHYDVATGKSTPTMPLQGHKCRNFDDWSLVRVRVGSEETFDICEPIYEPKSRTEERLNSIAKSLIELRKAMPWTSQFYCLFWRFESSDGLKKQGTYVTHVSNPQPEVYVKVIDGQEHIAVALGFDKRLYEQIRMAAASANNRR